MACVVTPEPTAATHARLTLRYCVGEAPAARSPWQALEDGNAAARALPLLAALAARRPTQLVLPLLDGARLEIEVTP
jgi:hypothetical protein